MSQRRLFAELRDPKDKKFIPELKKIPARLKIEHSEKFFKHILSFFNSEKYAITNDVGNEIILTICKLLKNKEHKEVFISKNFIKSLPYDNFLFCDNILNILYQVITDQDAARQILNPSILEPIAKRLPYKTLILLGHYFDNTDVENIYKSQVNSRRKQIQDSYEWIDLLFTIDRFKKPDCAQNYVSLLIYFLEDNYDFAKDYSSKVWQVICSLLQSQNDNIIKYAYKSLCFLIDNHICNFSNIPFDVIASHLTKYSLQKMAMSLLFRCKLKMMESSELIKVLIHLALTNRKAYIILQRIAETESGAFLLIENSSWMGKSLPDKISTVCLFCAVLMHTELRESLAAKPKDVTNFLITTFSYINDIAEKQEPKRRKGSKSQSNDAHQDEDSAILSIICTFLRRIPMNKDLVKQMSSTSFLGAYLSRAIKTNKNAKYALHVINVVANCCYVSDFLNVIDFLVTYIKKNDDISDFALETSSTLCKYRHCNEKFRQKEIDKYLLNLSQNTKYQKRFLRSMGAID